MIEKSLKYFLLGLLVGPVLINLIAFSAPFVVYATENEQLSVSGVVSAVQPLSMVSAALFACSVFFLTRTESRYYMRALCIGFSVICLASSSYGIFPTGGILRQLLTSIFKLSELTLLVLASVVLIGQVNQSNEGIRSANAA